jgi:hypothetical protein
MPIMISSHTKIEVCVGEIPDVFRVLWFDPITELEVPDVKGSYIGFELWLNRYRDSNHRLGQMLLDITTCN